MEDSKDGYWGSTVEGEKRVLCRQLIALPTSGKPFGLKSVQRKHLTLTTVTYYLGKEIQVLREGSSSKDNLFKDFRSVKQKRTGLLPTSRSNKNSGSAMLKKKVNTLKYYVQRLFQILPPNTSLKKSICPTEQQKSQHSNISREKKKRERLSHHCSQNKRRSDKGTVTNAAINIIQKSFQPHLTERAGQLDDGASCDQRREGQEQNTIGAEGSCTFKFT